MNNLLKTKHSRTDIGISTLERYTGSILDDFQPYILLTNFHKYLEIFAKVQNQEITYGSAMSCCHDKTNKITIINFGIGSPLAALIMELLVYVKPHATLMLGMCGGLRDEYSIGDYFNPVAAIREEGTSMAYLPERCPSLSSFIIQRYVCKELEKNNRCYRTGVIHTTNVRFWEFKKDFKQKLIEERAQAIDMESATLFTVGFVNEVPIGAMHLISDLPLELSGIKTKDSAKKLINDHSTCHVQMGVNVLKTMQKDEDRGFNYQF